MELPKSVVMMVVVVLVEPALLVKNVAVELVLVHQTVTEDNVVMMVVVTNHVDNVQALKPAQTEFVLEQPLLNVLEEFVVQTELEVAVDHAPLDKDVVEEFVNATMTVMTETVELLLKKLEPTLDFAHKDLVVHAQLDSHVTQTLVFALNSKIVSFQFSLLTVLPDNQLLQQLQLSSLKLHIL